jgi:density-regulated protein
VPKVTIARTQRSKHKFITVVSGLENFGIKLPEASKAFGKKFACGASVIKTPDGGEEIDVQGDVADDLAEFLEEKFKVR